MIQFLGSIAMIYLGYRILKVTFRTEVQPPPLPTPDDRLNRVQRIIDQANQRIDLMEQGRVLDQQLLNDSIARETRAKAALIAILHQNDVDPDGIQAVLDSIDNSSIELKTPPPKGGKNNYE